MCFQQKFWNQYYDLSTCSKQLASKVSMTALSIEYAISYLSVGKIKRIRNNYRINKTSYYLERLKSIQVQIKTKFADVFRYPFEI